MCFLLLRHFALMHSTPDTNGICGVTIKDIAQKSEENRRGTQQNQPQKRRVQDFWGRFGPWFLFILCVERQMIGQMSLLCPVIWV